MGCLRWTAWLALGCLTCDATPDARAEPAPAGMDTLRTGSERAQVLGDFLDRHWQLPVPRQGAPPRGWSEAEASLDPALCGSCHPQQWADWRTSLHAAAFSPGFAGQLIEGPLAAPGPLRSCQSCHAPLEEQQPFGLDGGPSSAFDPSLRAQGVLCAGCHLRAHRRHGPPRRSDVPPVPEPIPHGGFEVRTEFQESRFCAACHQFFDDAGVNGKPIENTYFEWLESPHAAAGKTCQSCHMPDRAHLWRGIHDPATVRAAVDVELVPLALSNERLEAALVLRSREVGHALPTYVTPRIYLELWQEDASGALLPETQRRTVIGREIDFGTWQEVFDTRVAPGESVKLPYAEPRQREAAVLVGRVTVDPDHHYRGVYDGLLARVEDRAARALIAQARQQAAGSAYVLREIRWPLP